MTTPVMYLTVRAGFPFSLALRFFSAVFTEDVRFFLAGADAASSSTRIPSTGVMLSAG